MMTNEYSLVNVNYFDVETGNFIENCFIYIKDDKISKIGSMDEYNLNCKSYDLKNGYVIPGLIDSHIHFFQSAGLYTRPDGLDLRHIKSYEQEIDEIKNSIPTLFKRYLACGITSVIDDGGPFWNKEVYNDAIKLKSSAPNIRWAGPLVSTVPREKLDLGDPPIIKAENEEHARTLVKNCLKQDPHYIKFWFIYQPATFEQDSKIMEAGIDEAKKNNKPVMVHARELETAKRAVRYGANILVHSVFTEDIDQEFIDLILQQNVIYIPTLMVPKGYRDVYRTNLNLSHFEELYGDPKAFQSFRDLMTLEDEKIPEPHRSLKSQWNIPPPNIYTFAFPNLRRLYKAGAIIASGTDAGNIGTLHGPSLHFEMELMVKAGMKPQDVLISTTKIGAQVMNNDEIGKIEVGKKADLVVLNKNPIEDIKNTREIKYVIRNGTIVTPDELLKPIKPEDIVDKQIEAYNKRNLEDFLQFYHPRITIYNLNTNELMASDLSQMRKIYQPLFQKNQNFHAEVTNKIIKDSLLIYEEKITSTSDHPRKGIAIYEVKNQLITKVWFI